MSFFVELLVTEWNVWEPCWVECERTERNDSRASCGRCLVIVSVYTRRVRSTFGECSLVRGVMNWWYHIDCEKSGLLIIYSNLVLNNVNEIQTSCHEELREQSRGTPLLSLSIAWGLSEGGRSARLLSVLRAGRWFNQQPNNDIVQWDRLRRLCYSHKALVGRQL